MLFESSSIYFEMGRAGPVQRVDVLPGRLMIVGEKPQSLVIDDVDAKRQAKTLVDAGGRPVSVLFPGQEDVSLPPETQIS